MTVRQIALSMLDEYELGGKYINLSMTSHITDSLSVKEKGQLTALLYTTVEHKLTYDYYISSISKRSVESIDIHTRNILRLGFCQLLHMDAIPGHAAVNETVSLGRHKGERAFINGILRRACAMIKGEGLPLPDRERNAARYLGIVYSFPLPTVKHFVSLLGIDNTEKLLSSFNSLNYTDITVNSSVISRDEMLRLLLEQGIDAFPSGRSHLSIRLPGSYNPTRIAGFDKGCFFVQDEICAVCVEALGIREGDSIVDVCACPGGKSFAAAILAGDLGRVLSLDIHDSKLPLVKDGAARLGLGNIKVQLCDAVKPDESLFGSFDRVICDVPCSGLGVLGKKSDIRYKDLSAMNELPDLQYDILCASVNYLKKGGTLVYSTCTLNPEENEKVAMRFLEAHADYSPCDFEIGDIRSENGMFTAYPHIHDTDGFFIFKLRKN